MEKVRLIRARCNGAAQMLVFRDGRLMFCMTLSKPNVTEPKFLVRGGEVILINGCSRARLTFVGERYYCEKCGEMFPKSRTECPKCERPVIRKLSVKPGTRLVMNYREALRMMRKNGATFELDEKEILEELAEDN